MGVAHRNENKLVHPQDVEDARCNFQNNCTTVRGREFVSHCVLIYRFSWFESVKPVLIHIEEIWYY